MVDAATWNFNAAAQVMAASSWYDVNPFEKVTVGVDVNGATVTLQWRDSNLETVGPFQLAAYTADAVPNIEINGQIRYVTTNVAAVVVGVGVARGNN